MIGNNTTYPNLVLFGNRLIEQENGKLGIGNWLFLPLPPCFLTPSSPSSLSLPAPDTFQLANYGKDFMNLLDVSVYIVPF
ncbi:MAG: hypothetical protein KME21_07360 [Desmonostoc vinosum HA7617-LM4]|nr:hypothetical protein [Desmonostoc vinosum HA7617-LM4]